MEQTTKLTVNTINLKSKPKYSISKPHFLIPTHIDRFLNKQSRTSQTPLRTNRLLNAFSAGDRKNTTSPPPNRISINLCKVNERKRRPLSKTMTLTKPSSSANTNKDKGIGVPSIIIHRKNQSYNIFQYDNKTTMLYNSKCGSKRLKELKINNSYKDVTHFMSRTNKDFHRKTALTVGRASSANANRSSLKIKSFIDNGTNNSNSNESALMVKNKEKENEKVKRDKDQLLLGRIKSASEKRFKVLNSKESNKKTNIPITSPIPIPKQVPVSHISKVMLNTVNLNKYPYNNHNFKKKKEFTPTSLTKTHLAMGSFKSKCPSSTSSSSTTYKLIKKRKRIRSSNSNSISNCTNTMISNEIKDNTNNNIDASNHSLSMTNTNCLDATTHNNTTDNTRNSFLNNTNNTTNNPNINTNTNISLQIKRPIISLREFPNHVRTISNPIPIKKHIITIEVITKKGFAGHGIKKINQDNYFIYKNLNKEHSSMFVGVCDGHGMFGHDVSGYLISHLPALVNCTLISKKTPLSNQLNLNAILTDSFIKVNTDVIKEQSIDTTYSGSTCVSLVFTPEKITCANVGDSRAVMGRCVNGTWSSVNLTRDHKPSDTDEAQRIIQCEGRIEAYRDIEGNYVGPKRVWLKDEDIPGLAMSRSIGDETAQRVGVMANPEITEFPLEKSDKFVILASDGIWEFIDSDECVSIIKDYYLQNDVSGALAYLCLEATKRWIQQEEIIDDITAIIIFFE